jgi:hypothetical protein
LLGPVVQVALEAPALFVPRLNDARTRGLDLRELEADLDAEPRHLDRPDRTLIRDGQNSAHAGLGRQWYARFEGLTGP